MEGELINNELKLSPYTTKPVKKVIWKLAFPVMGSMLLQDIFALVDMMWVGRLGAAAVAAITFASIYMGFVFMLAMGISSGTTALVARKVGSGDHHGAARVVGQSLILALICSVFTAIIGLFFSEPLIRFLGASDEVIPDAVAYLQIICTGSLMIYAMIAFNASFRAAGDAMLPFRASATAAILNIIIDPILIFGYFGIPALGVAGSAMATVTGRGVALIILFRGARRHDDLRFSLTDLIPRLDVLKSILSIGILSSSNMAVRNVSALLINRVVAGFGTTAMAAYGIGLRLTMAIGMPAFGMGIAAGAMVGQNLGAGKPERAREAGWYGTAMMSSMVISVSIIYSLMPEFLISLFTPEGAVIELGTSMLKYVSLLLPFMVASIVLSRSIDGAGDTATTLKITSVALILIQVPCAYLLAHYTKSPDGVWAAMLLGSMIHSLLSAACFYKGKWAVKALA